MQRRCVTVSVALAGVTDDEAVQVGSIKTSTSSQCARMVSRKG